jgi:hypothetical protein
MSSPRLRRIVSARHASTVLTLLVVAALPLLAWACARAGAADNPYPAAGQVPESQPGWEEPDPGAPFDEPMGGKTARGTPITKRTKYCFPAETRNVYSDVDMVAGPGGALQPFDYANAQGQIDQPGRDAIRGQNTWILWGEGNEAFWGWLQEQGYGLTDFLILLDSRKRYQRFASAGIINQPGMRPQTDPDRRILGLYLDEADGDRIVLQQPPWDIDPKTGKLQLGPPVDPHRPPYPLFKAGDEALYKWVRDRLPKDGLDYDVYGYPSGVVGLRLMPNPDFFGATEAAAKARRYWDRVVVEGGDAYYEDFRVAADPNLVRPFRVSMSCGFCHISHHPLNPPADPERPEWANMSSIVGNQFWRASKAFANLTRDNNALFQFLNSQQPGTIDTSLVSTDQINNANTITNIWDVPARVQRAALNPPEQQSDANLLIPTVEDPTQKTNPRHTPRILLDGSDSVGIFGALSRVYINIGTFPEEWFRCHNAIIGFKPQRPFSVQTLLKNSVFWNAGDDYRIPYLAKFFTHRSVKQDVPITTAMKLAHAPGGAEVIARDAGLAAAGRTVFLRNCAICHSSKQPAGFALHFSPDWTTKGAPAANGPAVYTLPQTYADWEAFRNSAAFADYRTRIEALAGAGSGLEDPFIKDNFLSTDIRVPITLVGTNSGRAVATNAMRGQVWDNFSSATYKDLPAVGAVHFYNPWSEKKPDAWGNNDQYFPPAGGPGYYRPASLISVWATSPLLHNNTLGLYNHDPSVAGRLAAFEDAIDKLLWKSKRVPDPNHHEGDLRFRRPDLAGNDPGFIYRSTADTSLIFQRGFIRPILVGILGDFWTNFLTFGLWFLLFLLLLLLAIFGPPRWAGFVFLLVGLLLAILLVLTGVGRIYWQLWLLPLLFVALALVIWLYLAARAPRVPQWLLGGLAVAILLAGIGIRSFVNGHLVGINFGRFPMGMTINLMWNMNPEAPLGDLVGGVSGLLRGVLVIHRDDLQGAEALKAFEREAALPLLRASKCPDFVLDRGHWFANGLSDEEKHQLKAFLRTL